MSAWTRRLAARAAELGDQEALATATGNLFGRAINARDRDEMRRLRPMLLAVITPEASAKALGWTHYFLALDAYVDGRFDEACEHAALSAASAAELGHEYMLATAVATRLLAESARDRAIAQAALAEVLELVRHVSVQPLAAFALWFVARYAAAVAPDSAAQWLAHAERIVVAIDSELWPESILRDECLAVLSIAERGTLLGRRRRRSITRRRSPRPPRGSRREIPRSTRPAIRSGSSHSRASDLRRTAFDEKHQRRHRLGLGTCAKSPLPRSPPSRPGTWVPISRVSRKANSS